MKKLLLASVALAALAAAPAFAADAIVEEPIVDLPVGFSWTGAYIGIQGGYSWGDVDRDTGAFQNSYDADGFLGGVHVGYNYQFTNNLVVGVEGDMEWAGLDGDDAGVGGTVDETDFNWQGSVRGRLGYAIDRLLVYGTGGVAFASIDHNNAGGVPVSNQETYTGWTAGAGVEYAFTDNLTTRLEYRYADFGSEDFAPAGLAPFSTDITTHTVRVGLSYKF